MRSGRLVVYITCFSDPEGTTAAAAAHEVADEQGGVRR